MAEWNADVVGVCIGGLMPWSSHGLTVAAQYWLSPATAGAVTATKPTTGGDVRERVLVPFDSDTVLVIFGEPEEL